MASVITGVGVAESGTADAAEEVEVVVAVLRR